MADLGNPIEAYLRAGQMQNQNRQQANQDLAGLGQGLGQGFNTIGQAMQEQKKKALLAQIVQAMKTQGAPQQGPQMPGVQNPTSGMGAPPQDNTQQLNALMMQYDPELAMKAMPTPLQQSEIAKNNAQAQRYQGLGGAAKPTGTIYRSSVSGEMTDDPTVATGPEWKAYKTTQGDVLNKLAGQTSGKARNESMGQRAEAMQRGIDTKQIDALISRTGVTPKQQSTLQMNNLRSARAISILEKPAITWQELALGEIDLTGIMQGGVPQRDEIVATHFPGWQEKVSQWKTYATGHPQETVPPDIKNKVKDLVQGVIGIDNTILKANAKFAKNMLGPTIRGGLNRGQNKSIDEMTGVLTMGGAEAPKSSTGTQSGGWSYVGPSK